MKSRFNEVRNIATSPKKISSSEIARLAGVSRSTVSRVINDYSNVPDATRRKVMDVIRQTGYYPSFSGQVLAGKQTKTLAFICIVPGTLAGDILFSGFFAHVVESAAEMGYLVTSCIVKNLTDSENIDWVKRVFMEDRVDGGIFIGVDNDEPLVDELIGYGKVIGVFDYFRPEKQEANRISVNFELNTGEKIIDYLYGLGHRKIATISCARNRYSFLTRRESFLRGMLKHGLMPRREWTYTYYGPLDGAYDETVQLIRTSGELPTAICPYNDVSAFEVYRALKDLGLRIPDDISVVGIDGHIKADLVSPRLTSIAFNHKDIFMSLVSRVIFVIEHEENVPTTEFFTSLLVERDSCRRL